MIPHSLLLRADEVQKHREERVADDGAHGAVEGPEGGLGLAGFRDRAGDGFEVGQGIDAGLSAHRLSGDGVGVSEMGMRGRRSGRRPAGLKRSTRIRLAPMMNSRTAATCTG